VDGSFSGENNRHVKVVELRKKKKEPVLHSREKKNEEANIDKTSRLVFKLPIGKNNTWKAGAECYRQVAIKRTSKWTLP